MFNSYRGKDGSMEWAFELVMQIMACVTRADASHGYEIQCPPYNFPTRGEESTEAEDWFKHLVSHELISQEELAKARAGSAFTIRSPPPLVPPATSTVASLATPTPKQDGALPVPRVSVPSGHSLVASDGSVTVVPYDGLPDYKDNDHARIKYPGTRPSYLRLRGEEKTPVMDETRRWIPAEESLVAYMKRILEHITRHNQLTNADCHLLRGLHEAVPQAVLPSIRQRSQELMLSTTELLVYIFDKVKTLPAYKSGEVAEYLRVSTTERRFPRSLEEIDATFIDVVNTSRILHNHLPSATEALMMMKGSESFLNWRTKYAGGLQGSNQGLITAWWRDLEDLYIEVYVYLSVTSSATKRKVQSDEQHQQQREARVKVSRTTMTDHGHTSGRTRVRMRASLLMLGVIASVLYAGVRSALKDPACRQGPQGRVSCIWT